MSDITVENLANGLIEELESRVKSHIGLSLQKLSGYSDNITVMSIKIYSTRLAAGEQYFAFITMSLSKCVFAKSYTYHKDGALPAHATIDFSDPDLLLKLLRLIKDEYKHAYAQNEKDYGKWKPKPIRRNSTRNRKNDKQKRTKRRMARPKS